MLVRGYRKAVFPGFDPNELSRFAFVFMSAQPFLPESERLFHFLYPLLCVVVPKLRALGIPVAHEALQPPEHGGIRGLRVQLPLLGGVEEAVAGARAAVYGEARFQPRHFCAGDSTLPRSCNIHSVYSRLV